MGVELGLYISFALGLWLGAGIAPALHKWVELTSEGLIKRMSLTLLEFLGGFASLSVSKALG